LAISDRLLADRRLALAFPPFKPPNRPNAAATTFIGSSAGFIAGVLSGSLKKG